MSNTVRSDEIDALVSSVRNFVGHKDSVSPRPRVKSELLVLTPAHRVDDEDALQTPVKYAPAADVAASNVLHLDAAQQTGQTSLEATIAELEAAVTAQSDNWEPDEGEIFAHEAWAASAFHQPMDDSPEPASRAFDNAEIVAQIAKEVEAAFGVRDVARNVLDEIGEDTLRVLVADVIREELAGALGEKITRNVRKLVRREINRVLASKALD